MKHHPPLAHGSLEQIFDGIYFIQGAVKMPMLLPMKISRAMTVLRVPLTAELIIVNSMRLSSEGERELEALGKVAHVLRIGGYHGRDDAYYRDRFGAKVYAIQGQNYTRDLTPGKPEDSYLEPDVWLRQDDPLPLPNAELVLIQSASPPEALLRLKRDGGILVTADSLQNTPKPDRFMNFAARIMMRRMGFFRPHLVGPAWRKFAKPSQDELQALLDIEFEHVLPGHGLPVIGGAREKYMSSIQDDSA